MFLPTGVTEKPLINTLYVSNWASEASPPSGTTGTIFIYIYIYIYIYICVVALSVSPDTVSFLNVSTRFYLGVHAVRNITLLCYTHSPARPQC